MRLVYLQVPLTANYLVYSSSFFTTNPSRLAIYAAFESDAAILFVGLEVALLKDILPHFFGENRWFHVNVRLRVERFVRDFPSIRSALLLRQSPLDA
jgi:hypothetical protein